MVAALFEAITNKYEASTLRAETNGMWAYIAAAGAELPYLTLTLVTQSPEWTFSNDFENATVQMSLWYADTTDETVTPLSELSRLYNLLTALYDECTLTIAGYTLVRMNRENTVLLRDLDGGWVYHVDYRVQLQEV